MAEKWAEHRKLNEKIQAKIKQMRDLQRLNEARGGVVEKPRFVLKSL
jgi:hypothetical protein